MCGCTYLAVHRGGFASVGRSVGFGGDNERAGNLGTMERNERAAVVRPERAYISVQVLNIPRPRPSEMNAYGFSPRPMC